MFLFAQDLLLGKDQIISLTSNWDGDLEGLEVDDAGSVYSGRDWTYRGNVIRYNFFHHIEGLAWPGWCVWNIS